jgi:ABC-type multidrug transport system fused ATPase/permease subunit
MLKLVRRCFQTLPKRDQFRVKVIIAAQFALSILDLMAITIFGALGSIAVRGVQSRDSSTFLDPILQDLGFGELNFQFKVGFLALTASLLLVTKTIISTMITRKSLHFLARKGADLSAELSKAALIEERDSVESLSSQEVLYALTNGVNNVTLGVLGTFIALASDISLLAFMSIALFMADFLTALATTIFFTIVGLTLYFSLHRRSAKLGKEQADVTIESNREILTVHRAYPEIFVRNTGINFINRVSLQRRKLATISAETAFLPYVGKYVIETAIVIGVLLLGSVQFLSRDAAEASGTLAFFIASATRIAPAILRLQHGGITINYSANASIKTLELMEMRVASTIEHKEVATKKFDFVPNVNLRKLSYRYPKKSEFVLNDINVRIEVDDFVAIVGPTGAGKSTLVEILLGIRSPTEGSVMVSGEPASKVHKIWPGKVAYVPQEVFIHHGSLRDNLLLGLSSLETRDEILLNALDSVGLGQFITKHGITLDSVIGEEGSTLSGGQRQRIGIARAILTQPEMLILDEATSSLDGVTELEISKTLAEMKSVKTLIVIAHRLSTIRKANKLIYLQEGRLIFCGSIEEARQEIPDFDTQARLMGLN